MDLGQGEQPVEGRGVGDPGQRGALGGADELRGPGADVVVVRAQAQLVAQAGGGARDGVDEQGEAGVVGAAGLVRGAAGGLELGGRPPGPGLRRGQRLAVAGVLPAQVRELAVLRAAVGREPGGGLGGGVLGPADPDALLAQPRPQLRDLVGQVGPGLGRPRPRLVPLRGDPFQLRREPVGAGDRGVALGPQPGDVGALPGVAQQRPGRFLVAGEDGDGRGVHRFDHRRRPLLGTVLAPPGHDLVGEPLGAAERGEHRARTDLGALGGGEARDGAHRGGQLGGGHLPDGLGHQVRDPAPHGLRGRLEESRADRRRDRRGGLGVGRVTVVPVPGLHLPVRHRPRLAGMHRLAGG